MPSPEQGGFVPPDHPADREREPAPYHRAARFVDELLARRVYAAVQDTIFRHTCDLSAYRVLLDRDPHVVVLGAPPPADLDGRLARLLEAGEPATLPHEVLGALIDRRRQMSRRGPWTEGHYRPGRPL